MVSSARRGCRNEPRYRLGSSRQRARAHRFWLAGIFGLAAWIAGAGAFAQPAEPSEANKERARLLMDRGVEREEARDYSAALSAYEEAHALVGLPMTGLSVARAQAALGRLVEALSLAQTVMQMPRWAHETPAYDKARTSAAALEQQLIKRIPAIVVQVEGAGGDSYTVTIDGRTIEQEEMGKPRRVDPGKHIISVAGEEFEDAQQEIEMAEGEVLTIPVVLKRLSGPRKSKGWTSSPLVWSGFGVGAAGIIAGSVTGILSLNQTNDIKNVCNGNACPTTKRDDINEANTLANVSNISFAIGGAGVVVGVVGILIAGDRKPNKSERWIRPVIGLGSAGVAGVF